MAARSDTVPTLPLGSRILRDALAVVVLVVAGFLLLALLTYDSRDPGWSLSVQGPVRNYGGPLGAYVADLLLQLTGPAAYVLVLGGMVQALRQLFAPETPGRNLLRWMALLVGVAAVAGLLDLGNAVLAGVPAGGILGTLAVLGLVPYLYYPGSALILTGLLLVAGSVAAGRSWSEILEAVGRGAMGIMRAGGWLWQHRPRRLPRFPIPRLRLPRPKWRPASFLPSLPAWTRRSRGEDPWEAALEGEEEGVDFFEAGPPWAGPGGESLSEEETRGRQQEDSLPAEPEEETFVEEVVEAPEGPVATDSPIPPLDLLDRVTRGVRSDAGVDLEALSREVEQRLAEFNITATVVGVHAGPVVIRFELEPAPGLKASRVTNVASDLARSLSVRSVRVVENVPGKPVFALEMPRPERETVRIRELLESETFQASDTPLTLALGADISGDPVATDLGKMPHLLVAGTTGAGKSVGINGMLLSLVYKATPEEVRLILVDPKMLELSVYDGIPHLLAPVVTDMSQAANAFQWCVAEMERRFQLMASVGARSLAGYNDKVRAAEAAGEPLRGPSSAEGRPGPELEALPWLVVVVDELADLMMVAGKQVEESITRLAQKARAAGIHLILATQRPSVDVLTGLIKANVPARIAFQVNQKVDSRTILDQGGAEQLLGRGDMLFFPANFSAPQRVHGAFVSDEEVERVTEYLRQMGEPEYDETVLAAPEGEAGEGDGPEPGDAESDPLYDQAVRIVTESRRASISNVQRKLRVGYNRAARLIDAMEASGVVGPQQSNGSREVLAPPPADG